MLLVSWTSFESLRSLESLAPLHYTLNPPIALCNQISLAFQPFLAYTSLYGQNAHTMAKSEAKCNFFFCTPLDLAL
jgi:hypothetical protein